MLHCVIGAEFGLDALRDAAAGAGLRWLRRHPEQPAAVPHAVVEADRQRRARAGRPDADFAGVIVDVVAGRGPLA